MHWSVINYIRAMIFYKYVYSYTIHYYIVRQIDPPKATNRYQIQTVIGMKFPTA
jgi:hypothetical protein